MTTAISFEGVSKRFTIHRRTGRTLRETVLGVFEPRRSPVLPAGELPPPGGLAATEGIVATEGLAAKEDLWALRDVSFGIEPGDCFGIIGPNGSGKSTALKLMTRILEPTAGRVRVSGRVSALLELGAGFHPDLTGRENIYLSGSVLGMDRQSMRRRLDEIVAFAELERFIDMPVKHYSSGMFMRLGFAIAINVDPDVLLTDEVLAVGDQSFQTKCMERIGEMKHDGVTIVFVSHSLETVRSLCNRGIWLDQGRVEAYGTSDGVVEAYLERVAQKEESRLASLPTQGEPKGRWGSGEACILGVDLLDAAGQERHVFRTGEPMTIRLHYRANTRVEKPQFGLAIYRSDGTHVNGPNTRFSRLDIPFVLGDGTVDYSVESLPLLEGSYDISVAIYDYDGVHPYDHQQRLYHFQVYAGHVSERYGLVYMSSHWTHTPGSVATPPAAPGAGDLVGVRQTVKSARGR